MFNQKMVEMGTTSSVIREIFDFGVKRKAIVGPDKVYDFSIGNPNVPAPQEVQDAITDIVKNLNPVEYHSYTPSAGAKSTRDAIAQNLNRRFGTDYDGDDVYLTCGAAASLNITLKSLIANEDDEVVTVAPYFPEYRFFVQAHGGIFVPVEPNLSNFQIDFDKLEAKLTPKTKAMIINTPNNPSGVVYSHETLTQLAELLSRKSDEYGHPIYLISDEPYRELVYGNAKEMLSATYYKNTIINYSWSKSLSLPGERIGYILIPKSVVGAKDLTAAVFGSARALGFVCAPSLFQKVIERCIDVEPDLTTYQTNRNLIYENLTKFGYKMAKPDGAFYAFVEAPNGNSEEFAERAKKYDVLVVPGNGFGIPSHMRISYCVATETIENSLPFFEKLIKEFK
jgi:aspartate aminotransferase